MALQPIFFSDGSPAGLLSANSALQYDAATGNILLSSPASVFGAGVTSSVLQGGDTNSILDGSRHIIQGGNGNTISGVGSETNSISGANGSLISTTGVWCSINGGNGHQILDGNQNTINGGGTCLISASGNGNNINSSYGATISGNSAESSIISSVNAAINNSTGALVTATNGIADGANFCALFGHNPHATAPGVFIFCDSSLARVPLTVQDAAAFYVSNGAVISATPGTAPNSQATLTLADTDKVFIPNQGTTAQRLALGVVPLGSEYTDTDLGLKFIYGLSGWATFAAVTDFVVINAVFSGPWASLTQLGNIVGQRIGNTVTLWFAGITDAANTTGLISTSSGVIPVGFRPIFNTQQDMSVIQDTGAASGSVLIDNTGGLTIGMNYANPVTGIVYENAVFQNLGQVGFPTTCVTYLIAG